MFTGIIEAVSTVSKLESGPERTRIVIDGPSFATELALGDSVAVNGVCLTVCELANGSLAFDAVRETLDRSALSDLAPGSRVNLERALRADGRLDGHIVQGHIDGVGRVERLERAGEDVQLFIDCDPELAQLLVEKGSVAIEGVSLTVVGVDPDGFDVVLIPYTLRETTLGDLQPGGRVNLEADVLGKYILRYLERVVKPGAERFTRERAS